MIPKDILMVPSNNKQSARVFYGWHSNQGVVLQGEVWQPHPHLDQQVVVFRQRLFRNLLLGFCLFAF